MIEWSRDVEQRGRIDWVTAIFYITFVLLGWLNIYAASYDLESAVDLFDFSGRAGSQLVWIGTSLVLAFVLMKIEVSFYETYAFVFYLFAIFVLLVTLAVAPDINGSRSWLVMGPIRLQPAEFMKFVIALALAKVFNVYGFELMKRKNLLMVAGIILLPTLLVIMQSETGTALVYLSFVLMLYREGLPGSILFMGVSAILYFILGIKFSDIQIGLFSLGEIISIACIIVSASAIVWTRSRYKKTGMTLLVVGGSIFLVGFLLSYFIKTIDYGLVALIAMIAITFFLILLFLRYRKKIYLYVLMFVVGSFIFLESIEYVFYDVLQPHQQMRIKVTLGMEQDLRGSGYHVGQSKIAIGSGGLTGKGFLNGTQTKLKYVPEQDTDFIFCTIGEEHGFIGSVFILLLFVIFILRLIYLAERQTSPFGRVYGYGVASVFLFHLLVNVGMVIGIMPVIGIPLPFFSYGGSSLWGFTIFLFIFLRIDKARKRS